MRRQRPPPPQPELFQLFVEEEPGGSRPPCLGELWGPQEMVQQCTVEQLADVVPMVQILDTPGLLGRDQVVEVLRMLDVLVIEQVIAVLKISLERVSQRSALRRPQTAEQLVEVRTELGYALPVIASKLCSRREIRRILPGLGSTASGFGQVVDIRFLRVVEGVVHVEVFKVLVLDRIQQRIWSRSLNFLFLRVDGEVAEVFKFLSQYRIQQRLRSRSLTFQLAEVFQIFSRAWVPLLPHRVVCVTMQMRLLKGVFALFSVRKKVRIWVRTRDRNCSPSRAHPRASL